MTSFNKIAVLTLLCLIASPAWSRQVDFCKVIRSFDDKDLGAPPVISYEDCSGVAFLNYGKYFVKAACWPGAIDLLDGKCQQHSDEGADDKPAADEDFEFETAE
ncbi:MAG: hypothetical protein M0R33_04495 [Methylomonas sp.]|jgi:hypothetical protein|uniref:hypothetical protein n=1 Tax=Methylomonas sp. TaxID=418 RepID=UPI0025E1047F|nr:hypothetical protein [Methylomonas sp.]MCK9605694.1 hypothetical protein [Methylomonas sp.]